MNIKWHTTTPIRDALRDTVHSETNIGKFKNSNYKINNVREI